MLPATVNAPAAEPPARVLAAYTAHLTISGRGNIAYDRAARSFLRRWPQVQSWADRPLARQLAGTALVLDHPHVLSSLWHTVEAEHLYRLSGKPALELVAGEVVHRADAPEVGSRDERVADLQRAALDQDRHDRAAAGVELGLDHRT